MFGETERGRSYTCGDGQAGNEVIPSCENDPVIWSEASFGERLFSVVNSLDSITYMSMRRLQWDLFSNASHENEDEKTYNIGCPRNERMSAAPSIRIGMGLTRHVFPARTQITRKMTRG